MIRSTREFQLSVPVPFNTSLLPQPYWSIEVKASSPITKLRSRKIVSNTITEVSWTPFPLKMVAAILQICTCICLMSMTYGITTNQLYLSSSYIWQSLPGSCRCSIHRPMLLRIVGWIWRLRCLAEVQRVRCLWQGYGHHMRWKLCLHEVVSVQVVLSDGIARLVRDSLRDSFYDHSCLIKIVAQHLKCSMCCR